jgi:hypothetical protein
MRKNHKELEAQLEKRFIKSDFGHDIHCAVLRAPDPLKTKGAVMMTTGFAGTIKNSMAAIDFYHALGY